MKYTRHSEIFGKLKTPSGGQRREDGKMFVNVILWHRIEFRSAGAGTLDRAEFAKWINVRNPLSKSTKRLAFSQKKRQKTIWSCYEKDTQRISLSTILSAEQELKRGWLPFESDTYANVKISLSATPMAEREAKRGWLLFVRYVSVASFCEGYAKISSFPLSFP